VAKTAKKRTGTVKAHAFFPFHQPWLDKDEEREVIATLRSGWLTTGAKTREFERRFAEYIGCKHAIGLNSCTAGLHLALAALGVGPGDEVITTPITFAATVNVIFHLGAKPVFVDVEPGTLNISAEQLQSRVTEKTKAIVPVHLYGQPCDMDRIMQVARSRKLYVVEDAAHAVGAEYDGKKIGSLGDLTAFSFYATKNITTGEGGMVTTERDDFAEMIRCQSLHGITSDAWERHGVEDFVHWDIIKPGYKYNMWDVQASLGIHQLKKIETFWKIRKLYVEMYNRAFREIPEIQILNENRNIKHAYHLYAIVLKTENLTIDRDRFLHELKRRGIGVGVHFPALHLTSFYAKTYGFKRGDFPNAEYASDRLLSLPLYPKMRKDDVSRVIKVVEGAVGQFRAKHFT